MGVLYIHSKDVTNISLSPMENEETHLPKLRSNLGHLCFVGRVPFFPYILATEGKKNRPGDFPLNPSVLIGILIMVYYNPV